MITNEVRNCLENRSNLFYRFLTVLSAVRESDNLIDSYEFYQIIREKFGDKMYSQENPELESLHNISLYRKNRKRTILELEKGWNSLYNIDIVSTYDFMTFSIHDVGTNDYILITSHEWDDIVKTLQPTD